MTHQAFADAVGVSRGAVQQWERGVTAPKRKNQPAVAAFMGITEAELMDEGAGRAVVTKPTDVQPSMGIRLPASGALEIEAAIETVAQALMRIPEEERMALLGKFSLLAHAPDSLQLKQTIAKAFGSAVPDAAFAQDGKKAA